MANLVRRSATVALYLVVGALFVALLLPAALDQFKPPLGPQRQDGAFLPFPNLQQAAGAIDLLRDAPSLETTTLRALNGHHFRAETVSAAPSIPDRLHAAPIAARMVRGFAGLDADSDLRVYTDRRVTPDGTGVEGFPALVVWRMADGRFFVLRDLDTLRTPAATMHVLGRSLDVWIGLLGAALAGLALVKARLEARPLRDLAVAAASFDGSASDLPDESGSAPDMRRLVRAMRSMQDRVTMLLQERSLLIGAISHDLKTFLTRLRLRAEHVVDPAEQARVVADLDGMTDLIETALAFARGTTVSRRRSIVDLADLVAIEVAERGAGERQVAALGDETMEAVVKGDPVALRRVLSNLLDNAVKFGRSRVEVGIEVKANQCRLSIDDDGPGIQAQERIAIFSPFYRIEGSRNPRTGGHGLGLAIARQIVEAHNGTVTVEDGRLGGACFVVTLPVSRPT